MQLLGNAEKIEYRDICKFAQDDGGKWLELYLDDKYAAFYGKLREKIFGNMDIKFATENPLVKKNIALILQFF